MFQIDGYKICFNHVHEKGEKYKVTFCTIFDLSKPLSVYSIGKAVCHPQDNFDKNSGRKLALTRALQNKPFSKEFRTKVWSKYFELRHGKKS